MGRNQKLREATNPNEGLEPAMKKRIWVAWETQRRSIELSGRVGAKLFLFDVGGKMRYPKSMMGTLRAFLIERPHIIFVQNPSMILATLACLYQLVARVPVVVDRHTTFLLTRKYRNTPRIILFKVLHRFTIQVAALTIVTNAFLARLVEKMGGRAFVLPDPLPRITKNHDVNLPPGRHIVLISSFGLDEPIDAVLNAMRKVNDPSIVLHITGNYRKLGPDRIVNIPGNVKLTGFLPDQDFMDLISAVDAIMVLTTANYCMLCGCYEAVSVKKPLITSDKSVLREYFNDALFVDNSTEAIAKAIQLLFENYDNIQQKVITMRDRINKQWEARYQQLEQVLRAL